MAIGRRRSRKTRFHKSSYTLETRIGGRDPLGWYRMGAVILLLGVLGGAGYAGYRGLTFSRDLMFARNDKFKIERIEVSDGQIKSADMIREYLAYEGIVPGANLFGFDIDEFRDLYLERNPLVREIEVQRQLPATLKVTVIERSPLARLGQREMLVSDRDGYVFRLSTGLHKLPVVIGDKNPKLAPGQYVTGLTRSAVDVLALCDDPRLGLQLLGVDIQDRDYMVLHIVTPTGIKEASLAWDGMGEPMGDKTRNEVVQQLIRVRQAAERDNGTHTRLDATFPGKVYAQ